MGGSRRSLAPSRIFPSAHSQFSKVALDDNGSSMGVSIFFTASIVQ